MEHDPGRVPGAPHHDVSRRRRARSDKDYAHDLQGTTQGMLQGDRYGAVVFHRSMEIQLPCHIEMEGWAVPRVP